MRGGGATAKDAETTVAAFAPLAGGITEGMRFGGGMTEGVRGAEEGVGGATEGVGGATEGVGGITEGVGGATAKEADITVAAFALGVRFGGGGTEGAFLAELGADRASAVRALFSHEAGVAGGGSEKMRDTSGVFGAGEEGLEGLGGESLPPLKKLNSASTGFGGERRPFPLATLAAPGDVGESTIAPQVKPRGAQPKMAGLASPQALCFAPMLCSYQSWYQHFVRAIRRA